MTDQAEKLRQLARDAYRSGAIEASAEQVMADAGDLARIDGRLADLVESLAPGRSEIERGYLRTLLRAAYLRGQAVTLVPALRLLGAPPLTPPVDPYDLHADNREYNRRLAERQRRRGEL